MGGACALGASVTILNTIAYLAFYQPFIKIMTLISSYFTSGYCGHYHEFIQQ